VAEYPELCKILKAVMRKETLKAQGRAFATSDPDEWRRMQGAGWGLQVAMGALDAFVAACAEKKEAEGA
jgi:hypothetical protein